MTLRPDNPPARQNALTRMLSTLLGLLSISIVTASLTAPSPSSAATEDPGLPFTRETMRSVFNEMKMLIPLSLNEEKWSAPSERKKVLAALERLEKAASTLERHGRDREAGFGELALNLAGELSTTREYYRTGQYDEARFFLTGTMQTCIACHVRMPTDRSFPLASELTDEAELDVLSPPERAWLLVTVRRFDEALATWEGIMRDESISASEVDSSGILVDYLNVAIRVRGDLKRASKALAAFSKRKDLPFYLARRVREWQDAIGQLDAKQFSPGTPASLERGASLAAAAGAATEGPYGRDGLIQDLAAASQLVRWLEEARARVKSASVTRNLTDQERSDYALAYYWLGIVEARSLDGFWVNLSERHLEAAIRSDPKGPLAERAYSLLEETQVLGYGGSSGSHLPTDIWNSLRELRQLMGIED